MTPDQRLLLIGGYISSALYLSGCFAVSLVHGGEGWRFALLSAGISCVSYAGQLASFDRGPLFIFAGMSWIAGMTAGAIVLLGG